jgi:hypothetical protein
METVKREKKNGRKRMKNASDDLCQSASGISVFVYVLCATIQMLYSSFINQNKLFFPISSVRRAFVLYSLLLFLQAAFQAFSSVDFVQAFGLFMHVNLTNLIAGALTQRVRLFFLQ